MSFKDTTKPRLVLNGGSGGGLSRSQSLMGPTTVWNSSSTGHSPNSPHATPILGEIYRSPRNLRKDGTLSPGTPALSKKLVAKLPKLPRPARTLLMFHSVKQGLRDCISATELDVETLRATEDLSAGSSTGQQVKSAERYQKKLEFHLSKIEELEDQYLLHQQLREGVKNMAKAYAMTTGEKKRESLLNVKSGFKECTQIMCIIEAQLENMLGTFHCRMKGLVGFARLIPGDVYEVTTRMGLQKWKTKGRIRMNAQQWDNDMFVFKVNLQDILRIKAVEVKTLGKSLRLGQKTCETKDLFSSHPQIMTISININGSIKLSTVITWNPLDGIDDKIAAFDITMHSLGAPRRRAPTFSGYSDIPRRRAYFNGDSSASDLSSDSSGPTSSYANRHNVHSFTTQSSLVRDREGLTPHDPQMRPRSIAVMGPIHESLSEPINLSSTRDRLYNMRLLADSLESTTGRSEVSCLDEALHNLRTTLEDYQGQYVELARLEEQVHALDFLIKKQAGTCCAQSADVSISIENALGAFDFLESEDYFPGTAPNSKSSRVDSFDLVEEEGSLSPGSTTKTTDSGIGSLAHRLQEEQTLESSIGASPESPSTGNDQADVTLLWHLQYCDRLLENLGCFGPLKCKEIYSLDKLKRQARLVENLVSVARAGPTIKDISSVMNELSGKKELHQLWLQCADQAVLYINAERLLAQLERAYGDAIREKYDISASKVFRVLIARILDLTCFDPEEMSHGPNVTLHQIFNFFNEELCGSLSEFLQSLAGELWVTSRLLSGDTDIVIKTLLTFHDTVPAPDCLRVVALLLVIDNAEVRDTAAKYLQDVGRKSELRQRALVTFVEALEDKSSDMRCGACIALQYLKGTECMEQLAYLSQADTSTSVQRQAKQTLHSFGDEGRRAHEETALTSHGFQGLHMHL